MLLLEITADDTGDWYTAPESGDYLLSLREGDDLGTGTLYIDVADFDENVLPGETDREITAVGAPILVSLKKGMKVRGRLTGATDPVVNLFLAGP
jgi:hypothetical protein